MVSSDEHSMTYEEWDQWTVPEPALAALISIRHWRLEDLVPLAVERHGFADDNGGFGITYPTDLDEYEREVEGITIPNGHVEAYGFWGADGPHGGYSVLVREEVYLSVLAEELRRCGFATEAVKVEALR